MQGAHHHAYIYEGSLALHHGLVANARELFNFTELGDPDVRVFLHEKFGIDEARELVRLASLKSVSGRALYVVGVSSITTEAQQALLKLFEEPQEGAIFVLLAPYGAIIATLRSRLLAYPGKAKLLSQKSSGLTSAQSFLSASSKDRSAEIAKLLKDEEGTKECVREFLNGLEVALYAHVRPRRSNSKEIFQGLEDVAKVRSYVGDRSPSMKMLLECLVISLPILTK